jgi:hypothetical protein
MFAFEMPDLCCIKKTILHRKISHTTNVKVCYCVDQQLDLSLKSAAFHPLLNEISQLLTKALDSHFSTTNHRFDITGRSPKPKKPV